MTKSLQKFDRNFDEPKIEGDITWYDARAFPTEGQAWPAESQPYTRLPDRAEGVVREGVWQLSRAAAGVNVRFNSNSTSIWVRYTLRFPDLAMPHMPAVGVSGVDLYTRDGALWKWTGVTRPTTFPQVEGCLVQGMDSGEREHMLYLPLYNGVEALSIGIETGAAITGAAPRVEKPILFYGTSVTQGGCAARAGMVFTSIVGRRLDSPVINLGFSGNGTAEPEMESLLNELDPKIYVIDCLGNLNGHGVEGPEETIVQERVGSLARSFRRTHPTTPVVLMDYPHYQNERLVAAVRDKVGGRNRGLRLLMAELEAEGMKDLHHISADCMWGDDDEATVDGIHATDVGFLRMADVVTPRLRALL